MQSHLRVVALIPAYNEERGVGDTIEAMLTQYRVPDLIVVIPNGCTDGTADVARRYPVEVLDLPKLEHKKSEALNIAWRTFAQDADLVVSLDADTELPPNAIADWEREFVTDAKRQQIMNRIAPVKRTSQWWDGVAAEVEHPRWVEDRPLGGSSGKFTFKGSGFLARMQRAEFASCTNQALRRGYTSVLAGAGCVMSGEGLRKLAARDDRDGPWCYDSLVEDYELTYRLRELGYRTHISPTVRAYTDPMKTQRALYGQRMKWATGMTRDLLRFGVNNLTIVEWRQTAVNAISYGFRIMWLVLMVSLALLGQIQFHWVWWVAVPALFVAVHVRNALRIPHRDRMDLAYAFMAWPMEIYTWMQMRWFFAAWGAVVLVAPARRLVRRAEQDRWAMQAKAEAWGATLWHKVQSAFGRVVTTSAVASVLVLLAGAAVPSLGVPNVGAALGLDTTQSPGRRSGLDVTVPAGYHAPTTCKGYVALTYDDGPTEYTVELADTLQAFGLHATFFLLGTNVQKDPDAVRHLLRTGHWVGTHTMSHANLVDPQSPEDSPVGAQKYGVGHLLTKDEQTREIAESAEAVKVVTGEAPAYFRPPFGASDRKVSEIVHRQGLYEAFWTKDTEDWKGKSPEEIGAFFSEVEDGDVLLIHDDEDVDVLAVPLIAAQLAQRGLCTGRLTEGTKGREFYVNDSLTSNTTVTKP